MSIKPSAQPDAVTGTTLTICHDYESGTTAEFVAAYEHPGTDRLRTFGGGSS